MDGFRSMLKSRIGEKARSFGVFSGVRWEVVLGFSTHWSWIWLVFWSSLFYSNYSSDGLTGGSLLLEPLWTFSLLSNAVGPLILLAFVDRRKALLGGRLAPIILAAALTSAGTFMVAEPAIVFSPFFVNAAYAIGSLLTGFGSAIAFVLWGEALTIQGSRSALAYSILAVLAAGFPFITFDKPLPLVGFSLHQVGYQYFYIVIWALWPVLARNSPSAAPALFPCVAISCVQGGQLIGSILGSVLMPVSAADPERLHMSASVMIFVILLVALFGFGNSRTGWGLISPISQEAVLPRFRRTCQQLAATHGLSERETEVFMLLAKGRNCARICERLVIAEPTAKTHIKNVYRKMGVHSQQELLDAIEAESAN